MEPKGRSWRTRRCFVCVLFRILGGGGVLLFSVNFLLSHTASTAPFLNVFSPEIVSRQRQFLWISPFCRGIRDNWCLPSAPLSLNLLWNCELQGVRYVVTEHLTETLRPDGPGKFKQGQNIFRRPDGTKIRFFGNPPAMLDVKKSIVGCRSRQKLFDWFLRNNLRC